MDGFFSPERKTPEGKSSQGKPKAAAGVRPDQTQGSGPKPPNHALLERYEAISEEAKGLLRSNALHSKKAEYEALKAKKEQADREYSKEGTAQFSFFTPAVSLLGQENDPVGGAKVTADGYFRAVAKKAPGKIQNRERLEKHKGSSVAVLVRHAAELQEDDDILNSKEPGTKEKKDAVLKKRSAANSKAKEQVKEEKATEQRGFLSTVAGHLGNLFGGIGEGIDMFANLGASGTKNASERLAKANQYKNDLSVDVKEASESGGIMAALLSLVNTVIAGIELGKCASYTIKNWKNKAMDNQEKFLWIREALKKVADLFGSFVGVLSPFISNIPFLGSSLGIADSGIQMLAGNIELSSNVVHVQMMNRDKQGLWSKIEQKRKENGNRDEASYFDTGNKWGILGGKGADAQRDSSFSAIEAKRKQMLAVVSKEMGIRQKMPGEQLTKDGTRFDNANNGLSTRIAKMRNEHESQGPVSQEKEKQYQKRMRMLEALELFNQYRTTEKAQERMKKLVEHNLENFIKNGVKLVGNGLKLVGEITAASGAGLLVMGAGSAVNLAAAGYELARDVGSKIYAGWEDFTGATANKKYVRSEMADMLFDKMVSIGPKYIPWKDDFFKLDGTVSDEKVEFAGEGMDYLNSVLRRGLDAKMTILVQSPSAGSLKQSLASAFSQGGVSAAADS